MRTPLEHRRRQNGASLVEFVIVFPIAVLFVLTLIQVGFIYMAKLTLNHATFTAARVGSLHNADPKVIREALLRGLIPFYQNSLTSDDAKRLLTAWGVAQLDNTPTPLTPWAAQIDRLSPNPDTFADFGVKDPSTGKVYIPNDNLEWRSLGVGSKSKVHIRDANLLKIRVTYGYEMHIPLIGGVIKRMMCGGTIGPEAFGNVSVLESLYGISHFDLCVRYFMHNRIPIESMAIVEMQTPAYQ